MILGSQSASYLNKHSKQLHQNTLHFGGSVQNKMPLQKKIASGIFINPSHLYTQPPHLYNHPFLTQNQVSYLRYQLN
jgi:hypothetical protein